MRILSGIVTLTCKKQRAQPCCSSKMAPHHTSQLSFFHDLFSRSMTWEYRGLQGVTGGYKGEQGVTASYRGLQRIIEIFLSN